jgi:hypothetical protein
MAKLYAVHTKTLSTEKRDKGIAFFHYLIIIMVTFTTTIVIVITIIIVRGQKVFAQSDTQTGIPLGRHFSTTGTT